MKHRRRKSRRSFSARNPAGRSRRRRSFSFRNPSGAIAAVFSKENMTFAGGIVTQQVGTALILNKLLLPGTDGKIPMALPGVDTTKAGYMGSVAVSAYKLLIGGGIGYLVMRKYPRFGQGMIVGAVASALSDVVKQSNVLASLPGGNAALGLGRYFPSRQGAGSYTPGVPAVFTGPASGFLANGSGSPMAGRRPGMGTMVTRRSSSAMASSVQDPFAS